MRVSDSNQQRIHPFHIRRRILRQAAFGQQGLVVEAVGQVVEVHAAVELFHQRMLGVHFEDGLVVWGFLAGLFEQAVPPYKAFSACSAAASWRISSSNAGGALMNMGRMVA